MNVEISSGKRQNSKCLCANWCGFWQSHNFFTRSFSAKSTRCCKEKERNKNEWRRYVCEFANLSQNHWYTHNLQYYMLGRWDEWLIDQVSDVPSIIFFHGFLQNSLQKYFQSICLFEKKNTKIKVKSFECPKSIKSLKK